MGMHKRIGEIIIAICERLEDAGEAFKAQEITQEVCDRFQAGLSEHDDRNFWTHCGHQEVRDQVRAVIGKRYKNTGQPADEQLVLPGFRHLQKHYLVERGGDEVAVPIDTMTDEELDAKSELYRSMGLACFQHADEIQRYKSRRSMLQAAE